MITGYNTDVEHDGVVYHVQTEDKGLENPMLLSLVYVGGTILASKRTSYADLIEAGFDELALSERLQRQHRLICAAINAGRIDDLKKMTAAARSATLDNSGVINPEPVLESTPEPVGEESAETVEPKYEFILNEPHRVEMMVPTTPSYEFTLNEPDRVEANPVERQPPPDVKPPVEEEPRQPPVPQFESTLPPAVQAQPVESSRPSAYTVYDARRRERAAEGRQLADGLHIDVIGDKDFCGGDDLELELIVTEVSSKGETPVSAAVSVKVLGTAFRPVLLSLKTNRQGFVVVNTHIPNFNTGRAAIVIRAKASGLSTETRRVIHPG